MNLVLLYESLLLCEPVVSGDPNSDAVTIGMPDNDLCIEYREIRRISTTETELGNESSAHCPASSRKINSITGASLDLTQVSMPQSGMPGRALEERGQTPAHYERRTHGKCSESRPP